MNKISTLLIVCLSFIAAHTFGQEVCNNGIDDDGNGFIDCYDNTCVTDAICEGFFLGNDAACQVPPPDAPAFSMELDFSSPDESTNHLARIAIGDLDRDGIPEMVTMNRYTRKLFIINGNNGSIKAETTVTWEPNWEIAIANLDNDNCAEIFFLSAGHTIFSYDCDLNLLWSRAIGADPINFGLADFDGDGKVELYAKDAIYDAHTGTTIIRTKATFSSDTNLSDLNYQNINGGPVAVDILGDSKLELVVGCQIYDVNLGTRTANSGTLTLLNSVPSYFVRDEYNATSVADFNQDGYLDVIASGSLNQHKNNTTVFFWDVQNNTVETYSDPQPLLGASYTNGWKNGTGRLNIGDLDGDGLLNVSFVSGRFLYALDENFDELWRVNINEETSGHTGCTLFDFNGDGQSEIVYRDERFIYIIRGSDGSIFDQQPCISRTNREYPIVADVDGDGSTEICVPCGFNDAEAAANFNTMSYSRYAHIRIFKSASEPWVPARKVWNQHGYFNVNINDDLTVPIVQQKHHLTFYNGPCRDGDASRPRMPLNSFLNQSPFLDSRGCPVYASPNLNPIAGSLVVTPPTCPNVNYTVSFQFENIGEGPVSGSVPITFYNKDPRRPGATKFNTINVSLSNFRQGQTHSVTNVTVTGNGSDSLYVVLNDAGTSLPTPITLPNTNFYECDYDNIFSALVVPNPVALTALKVQDNIKCPGSTSPDNGSVRAFVPISGGGENIADYDFYWSNGSTAIPLPANYTGALYNGRPAGFYTVFARHKTANCSSDTATVEVLQTPKTITPNIIIVKGNDNCVNPNGELRVVINDTDNDGVGEPASNFKYGWWEGTTFLSPDTISIGSSAINLEGTAYTVYAIERSSGCWGTDTETVPDLIVHPSLTTSQINLTCLPPGLGSVTATANGVTAGHTFNWFNGATVKPTADFTGSTYGSRPLGSYTVFAVNNTSQCNSDTLTLTLIKAPDPIVSGAVVSHMTSCNASSPNGSASANVGGTTTGYTFEWFRGQNTLLANRESTSSTATGLRAGIYTVRATDIVTGCFGTSEVTINSNVVIPTLSTIVTDQTTCTSPNGQVLANVSSGTPADYTFSWYNGSGIKVSPDYTDTDNILSGLVAETYTVRAVNNLTGCITAPVPSTVNSNLAPIVIQIAGMSPPNDCSTADGSISVTVTSPGNPLFNVEWYRGRRPFSAAPVWVENGVNASQTGNILPTGVYTAVATNPLTGCRADSVYDLPFLNIHELDLFDTTHVYKCNPTNSGSIEVTLSPTVGFDESKYDILLYSGPNDVGVPLQTMPGVIAQPQYLTSANLTPGFYTLVAVFNDPAFPSFFNCRSIPILAEVKQITNNPVINANPVHNTNCTAPSNGEIQLTVSDPGDATVIPTDFSYAWSFKATPASAPVIMGVNSNLNPTLASGEYTVNVTKTNAAKNSTGCSSIAIFQVLDTPPTISLAVDPDDIIMCTNPPATGGAEVTDIFENSVAASMGDYTFNWMNSNQGLLPNSTTPNTTNIIATLSVGDYFIRATKNGGTNGLGCESLTAFRIVDMTMNTVAVNLMSFVTPTRCLQPTNNTGTLQVDATGNSASGYSYNWYAGTTVATGSEVSTSANFTGITVPVGQQSVTYTVQAINNTNGCDITDTYTLPLTVTPVTITASAAPLTQCLNFDGTLYAHVTSGNSTLYNYAWTRVTNSQSYSGSLVNGVENDLYSVVATDQSDSFCQTQPMTVEVSDGRIFPIVTAMPKGPVTNCDPTRPNGVASASVDGDVSNYNLNWFVGTPPSGTPFYQGAEANSLQSGLFSVIAYNIVTGCSDTTQLTIEYTPEGIPAPLVEVLSHATSCVDDNGILGASIDDGTVEGNTKDYIFYWYNTNPGPTPDITTSASEGEIYRDLAPGRYYVNAVSRITGCASGPADEEILDSPSYPDFEFEVESATCQENDGFVSLILTSSNVEIESIVWTPATTASNGPLLSNAPAGLYSVTVTSKLGCATTKDVEVKAEIHPYNGISRNNDGMNETFYINCIDNFPNNHVQIFNRAGTLVYEADGYDNIDIYFDGKSNKGIKLMGNNLPDGTYYYVIDKRDGSKKMAGYLEIVN
jgi:gliding motility-associated-like protein